MLLQKWSNNSTVFAVQKYDVLEKWANIKLQIYYIILIYG